MIEEEFQQATIELAHLHRWRVAHFRKGRTKKGWRTPVAADGKGFPDLLLVRDRIMFRELKTDYGKLTDEQKEWGKLILRAGGDWRIWRPEMMDQIIEELR